MVGESYKVLMVYHDKNCVRRNHPGSSMDWTGLYKGRESRGYFIQQVRNIKRMQEDLSCSCGCGDEGDN